jgi:two-component system response regulator
MNDATILLVEDSAVDEELTLLALRKAKILNDVVVARDGAEALDYLFGTGAHAGRGDQLPQLVLLDLNLPKLSGVRVLQRMRADERWKLVPVVILTSSKEDRDLADGYHAGANSYVVKPINFDQFADAVKQLGLYWLVLNTPLRWPRVTGTR